MSAKPDLSPVPSEGNTCANCSAPLVADQRYCLACGQPVSPVRLAFLDVLQSDRKQPSAPGTLATAPVAYAPVLEPSGWPSWLRRYTPLFSVASVLLLALVAGLLVGHWATQGKSAPATQVIKVEGLSAGAPAAAASTTPTPTASTPATSSTPAAKSSPKAEAEEVVKEAKAEKQQAAKVEHTKVVKSSSDKLKKLNSSTGKKHAEEVNALGEAPIETGG